MEIGKAQNKDNLAKAEISWYPGTQIITDDTIQIRVTGPEGNSAEADLFLASVGSLPYLIFYARGKTRGSLGAYDENILAKSEPVARS